jgi:hypothetical protein
MINITALQIATLILTSIVWAALLIMLLLNLPRARVRSPMVTIGVLAAMTGALLVQIADMAGWPHGVRLVVDGGAALLGLALIVCVVAGAIRQSADPPAPARAVTGPASPRRVGD